MLFHCKPVNQQKTSIFTLILCEEQRQPFLKRKKVPKFYFHFGQQKMCSPFSFNIYLAMWKYNCEPLCMYPLLKMFFSTLSFLWTTVVGSHQNTGARSYIFTSPGMYYKEEGRTLFGGPKVKVEFCHLFSLQKRFSLCSCHNINANIVVFCWLTGLQWNNTRF